MVHIGPNGSGGDRAKQISVSAVAHCAAARAQVFSLLADSSTWSAWTPFREVTVLEPAPDGGGGVGEVKRTRYGAMTGRERILSVSPDRQLSYAYVGGAFTPYIRDYVGVVDLTDDGGGTRIHWHSTFLPRFAGSGWLPRRVLTRFLQRCADGLASGADAGRGDREPRDRPRGAEPRPERY